MVSRDANSSRLSVQKVAVAVRHTHTHGGVWLNIPRRQRNIEASRMAQSAFR